MTTGQSNEYQRSLCPERNRLQQTGVADLARSTNHIVRPRVRCGLANSLASAACYSHFEEPGMSSENEIPVADLPEEQNSGFPPPKTQYKSCTAVRSVPFRLSILQEAFCAMSPRILITRSRYADLAFEKTLLGSLTRLTDS